MPGGGRQGRGRWGPRRGRQTGSDARLVLARSCINANDVTHANEERYLDDQASLEGRRLARAGRRIASESWVSLGNDQVKVDR